MELTDVKETKIDWGPIIVVILGSFMAFLNSSIVNVAVPKMMVVFGASQDDIQWIITGYMLALGVVMPLSGYLGDTFGYKRCFITALTVFTIGTVLCGLAWSIHALIAARVLQAAGGGVMQPLGMALIYKLVPRHKIGTVLGVFGISAMVAPAIAPTLGGYLIEYANWRLIFYISIPIGLFNIFQAFTKLTETELIKGKLIDKWGIFTSTVGFFCLLMALSKGSSKGWDSPFIVGLLFIAGLSLTAFVFIELNHPAPILELRLLKNSVFTLSIIISSVISIGMFGATFLMPIFMQNILGLSAVESGLVTLPAAVAAGIMMPISGKIFDQYGARMVSIVGMGIFTFTTFMMHTFDLMTPLSVMVVWLTVRGVGMGLANMPISTAGMNTVPKELVGSASAMSNVTRQVAGSFGIAVFTTILQNREIFHAHQLSLSVNLNSDQAIAMQQSLQTAAVSNGISGGNVQIVMFQIIGQKMSLMAAALSIEDCFIIAAALCLLALLLCPFMRSQSVQKVQ